MEVIKTLQPGQPGTRRYQNRFGKRLVCVRYRQDKNKKCRYTTVELVMEERPIQAGYHPGINPHPNRHVWIRISYEEIEYRKQIKQMGGKWDNEKKLWKLPCKEVQALGLESRIINRGLGDVSKNGNK